MSEKRRVGEEVIDAVRFEEGLEARAVRAFRQPDAGGIDPGEASGRTAPERELRVDGGLVEQRQVAVRRSRREDLDVTCGREVCERRDHVAPEPEQEGLAECPVRPPVELGELPPRERRRLHAVPVRAGYLVVDVLEKALLDLAVRELLEERRRETDGDAVRHVVLAQVVERDEERQVGPQDRLVDPLFTVRPATGAADEREVRMQDEEEGVGHRGER